MKSLSVVIPAYNEEAAIAEVVRHLQETLNGIKDQITTYEIIVVDDGSMDATGDAARQAGATVFTHHVNRGYGAALKTGIRRASHDWIALFDADGQHRGGDLLRLIELLGDGYDSVIGARDPRSFQYAARMPGKKFLHLFAAFLVNEKPQDVNSGLRLFRKSDALTYFAILPNQFSFTTTLTLAMTKDAYDVGWLPIQTNERQGRKSTVNIKDGLRTILLIIRIAMLFNPLKIFLPISGILFATGIIYAGFVLMKEFNIPDGATIMLLSGVLIFLFGFLADQLASIRRGG